ncbi:pentapeptide repeat-containing protein [Candidatus Daviesbacteria bacterium]|nr:pentapeptide repeat-containing protein [Candidatus Daviesbacteria bacterium]
MPKIKSSEQQLSRESLNELKLLIEKKGWSLVPIHLEDDFGADGQVELFVRKKKDYEYSPYSFKFQLKSTTSGKNTEDFSLIDLKTWCHSPIPFFLFFWNKAENKFYWINLHEFCNNLELTSPEKFEQTYLKINFENELNVDSFNLIEMNTRNLCKMAARAINDNVGKQVAVGDLAKQGEPIIALGYSFKKADLSKMDMRKAIMMGIDFNNADLSHADMRSGAFMGANFKGANLDGADLRSCSFMGAFLEKAKLRTVKLQGAAFMGAFVEGADFSGAEWDDISLWSISKSYDFEKAIFDEGILGKIVKLGKINNLAVNNLSVVNNKQDISVIDKWIAVKTENEQGADYRSVPLEGKPLNKITFRIKPMSPFWRAGLKIVDPNGSFLPLRSVNSILFHLGSTVTNNFFGITAYVNGELVGAVNKSLKYDPLQSIIISFEVNQNNFVKFFVNGSVEFEPNERINPRLLKKACLVAWGDINDYKVGFDEIKFLPRAA